MKAFQRRWLAAAALAGTLPAYATSIDNACSVQTCAAGQKAITFAEKRDPYYACPTRELATYTNFVIGLVSVSATLSGQMPNISDETGEPEYKGETKAMLDNLRTVARVRTFDQAVAMCAQGANKLRVTVMNNPADEMVIWVFDAKHNRSFWMPTIHLNKL